MANKGFFIAGAVVAAAALGVAAVHSQTARAVPAVAALPVSTSIAALNRDDPAQLRVGQLVFRGAIQIRSSDPVFGGISGLRAGPGNRMLAISDTGNWLAFDTLERDGRLVGIANAVIAPIRQPDGGIAADKTDGDAEGLEWDPATGAATIVYEQEHRLVHFTGIDAARPGTLAAVPVRTERLPQMAGWPANGGGEAMAVLPGGARIVISETAERDDGAHVALVTRAGKTMEIGITGVEGHRPTDAVALDDHRILVVNRRFTLAMGQGAAIAIVDLAPALTGIVPVSPLPMQVLARWQPPVTLDNMEGIAIRRSGARTFVYVVSDDNFNALQRTLLMKFELGAWVPSVVR